MKVLTNTISLAKGTLVLGILSSVTLSHASSSAVGDLLNQQFTSVNQAIATNACVAELSKNSQVLRNIRAEGSILSDMRSNGADLISASFQQRLKLVETLKKATLAKGAVTMDCEIAFRKYINSRRLFEEYTAISAGLDDSPDVLQGKSPQLLVNPKYGKFALKSGDILVSRGTAVVSAAIAKIGVQEGIYSHAAMVYIDPATKKVYLMQAEIETGVEALPIEENYLADGKVRANVYRTQDEKLAAASAKWMFDYINAAKERGTYIRYNFEMDFSKEDIMYCSQLPFMAYQKASNNKFLMGDVYKTSFLGRKNRSFLNGLKITVPNTFSPNDVELDGKLELVAEWRDYSRVGMAHRRDAVMDSLFKWMDEEGYNFNKAYSALESTVILTLRKLPVFRHLLEDSVADNIKLSQLKYFMTMNTLGSAILKDYVAKEDATTGNITPSYNHMLQMVDQVKQEDMQRAAVYKSLQIYGEPVSAVYESHFMKYLN